MRFLHNESHVGMKTGLPKNFIDTSRLVKKREAAGEEETHLAANFIRRFLPAKLVFSITTVRVMLVMSLIYFEILHKN